MADLGFAGEVLLGEGAVGVQGLAGQEPGHGLAELGGGLGGHRHHGVTPFLSKCAGDALDVGETNQDGFTAGW
ncbi:hypothetical protein [Streptomyces avermitilis]|uniref:hypothetical protein n=1 Tax=Streptomyces avermitilis TaxID=33903 RepID=UPI00382B9CF5